MNSPTESIVTTPGASEPQGSAVVGGSSVKTGSNVAGPLRSSSNDREGAGVASQAPVTLADTSAEKAAHQAKHAEREDGDRMRDAIKALKRRMVAQDEMLAIAIDRAAHLEVASKKTHSPTVSSAIRDLLEIISGIGKNRENVNKAFNVVLFENQSRSTVPQTKTNRAKFVEVGTQTSDAVATQPMGKKSTVEIGTDTPCWWENAAVCSHGTAQSTTTQAPVAKAKPPRKGKIQRPSTNVEDRATTSKEQEAEFIVVQNRKTKRKAKADAVALKAEKKTPPTRTGSGKRRHPPRTQAVVLDKPANLSYAEAVREVKEAVLKEPCQFIISTRRAKSGNLVLETNTKEHADDLASALKRQLGETRNIRRPSPSVALLLIDIEDSVDEKELIKTLIEHDPELKVSNDLKIREGRNGVRTTIVRVPLTPGLKLARLKKLRVGWATCRIKELASKPGCAKCSAAGHATSECKGEETRKCFRCKAVGHLIATCTLPRRGEKSGEADQGQPTEAPARPPDSLSCLK
jgi:hypothetical protein